MTANIYKNGFVNIFGKKIIYIEDVVVFLKNLQALDLKIFRLIVAGICLAIIEVVALLVLAAFVNVSLQQSSSITFGFAFLEMVDFASLGFFQQASLCLFVFLIRFISSLLLQNYILLQSSEMQVVAFFYWRRYHRSDTSNLI